MFDLGTFRHQFKYNDWANEVVFTAASGLNVDAMDRPIEMGPGSLRKTLFHIYAGEFVWLKRWKGEADTKWLNESDPLGVGTLAASLKSTSAERNAFLESLRAEDLPRPQRYLDSKGSYFTAPLGGMVHQLLFHSAHHRAQAVNMLRQVGAVAPELDYMTKIREADKSAAPV